MPTIPPTITPAPTAPQRGDRNTFSARVDAFLTWLVGAVTQFGAVAENAYDNAVEATDAATTANSAVSAAQAQVDLAEELVALAADQATAAAASAGSALNAPGTSATSTTSRSIASGPVTLTIQAGKAFVVGQFVVAASAASPENYMAGQITAHNAGSGSLTINATQTNGSGTYADWSVAVAGAP
ncbi:MAG: hypothetical protein KA223_06505, partial [Candidatus Accumulibacter sp.]|nr:hypothetical protein [Accumulibacter sp.]